MTQNRRYEGAQLEICHVLTEDEGEVLISFLSLFSLTWHVETFGIPTKYKELFCDLSDVRIPLETVSIGMELGEGKVHQFQSHNNIGKLVSVVTPTFVGQIDLIRT